MGHNILASGAILSVGDTVGPVAFSEPNDDANLDFHVTALADNTVVLLHIKEQSTGRIIRTARIEGTGKRELNLSNTPDDFTAEIQCLSGRAEVDLAVDSNLGVVVAGFSGNTTNTVIASAGAFVPVAGTLQALVIDGFHVDPGGEVEVVGIHDVVLRVGATIRATKVGGGAEVDCECRISSTTTGSFVGVTGIAAIKSGKPATVSAQWFGTATPHSIFVVEVANVDDTADILVSELLLSLERLGHVG